jgi:hypothetical protein
LIGFTKGRAADRRLQAVTIFVYAIRSAETADISAVPALPTASVQLLRDSEMLLSHFVKNNAHDRRKAVSDEFMLRVGIALASDKAVGKILREVRKHLDVMLPTMQ